MDMGWKAKAWMSIMLKSIRTLSGKLPDGVVHAHHAETRDWLVQVLGSCPHCGLGLRGHGYSRLAKWHAGTATDRKQRERFLRAVKDHNWSELAEFRWGDSLGASLEVYIVRCPIAGLCVVVVKIDSKSFRRRRVLFCESLARNESYKLIAASLVESWQMF